MTSALARARNAADATLIVLCQSSQSLAFGGIGLFLPLIRQDIGFSFTQAGTLAGATTLAYAFMQIPAGYIADRFGAKRVFATGLLGTNFLALVLAQVHEYRLVLATQAINGVFRSLVFAPGLLVISALFPRDRRATAMGLYVAGGFSSSVLLNAVGPLLVQPFGWRALFMGFSVLGFALLGLYWRFGPPGPSGSGVAPISLAAGLRTLLGRRFMWGVGGIQFIRLAVASGLSFWLPTVIIEKGYPLHVAGLMVAISAAVTVPSNFLGGYLSDRFGKPYLIIALSLGALAVTTFLIARVNDLQTLTLVVAVNGFFVQLYFGPLFAIPIGLLGSRMAGLASGYGNFIANLGGFASAYFLGALRDASGTFAGGIYILSFLCLLGVLLAVALAATYRQPLHQRLEVPNLAGIENDEGLPES